MLTYPDIKPEILQLGPFTLRWYGAMYALSFFLLITIMRRQSRSGYLPLGERMVERLFIYLVLSLLIGARLFYVIFYGSEGSVARNPLEVLAIWHGGLSFHGGLVGVMLASYLVARQAKVPWVSVADTLSLIGPIGLFFGRVGNFINGELYGRPTTVPWAMVFPADPLGLPRHPSQIYEALAEGVALTVVLWLLKRRIKRHGVITAVCLLGYAVARITCEFFREPDRQLGFILGPFTMGQLLSIGVLVPGILFLRYSLKSGPPVTVRHQRAR